MAIPTYPPNVPTSPSIVTAERGQANYFFKNLQAVTSTAAGGNGAAYGANTLLAPVPVTTNATQIGPQVFGIPPSKAVEAYGQDYMVQVDVFTSTTGGSAAATVAVMGSLDGVGFYKLASVAVAGVGTVFSLAAAAGAQVTNTGTATPGVKFRYLTAAVTAYTGGGGATDSVTASFIM